MEGHLNPGSTTSPMPPFVARPVPAGSERSEQRPLPPWTSGRRVLEPAEPAPTAPPIPEQPAAEAPVVEPEEIWTLEPVEEEETADQLWTLEVADVYEEAEPLTEETIQAVDDGDPWAIPALQATVEEEPWGAAAPSEAEALEEPWTFEAAEPVLEETEWTLEPVVEGGVDSWADQVPEATLEPPLLTFPGEAEVWEAVAASTVPETSPEIVAAPEAADPRYTRMAELLESFAAELRTHGAGALTLGLNRDRLSAALAGFVAGFEAASQQD